MAEHRVVTTEAEFETALEKARIHDNDPVTQSVAYVSGLNLLIVGLSNGRRLALPLEDLQGFEAATAKKMERHELLGQGTGIRFSEIDVDLYVPALIEGVYGIAAGWRIWGRKAVGLSHPPGGRPPMAGSPGYPLGVRLLKL